ncbi:MAG: MFS transporter [Deltaproteobacteria bacterium]|nr:MFS transporter [Deltaproteobacteria bacterium]
MALLLNDGPAAGPAADEKIPASSWYGLAVLFTVYLLNFLDRTLIYILFGPIKKEMALTETQLALLGSTSFVIFYTLLGVPFGRLADRVVRKKMIAVGLVIWSVFSGLTGFMESFTGIFLCRLMVGVGEATLGPAALSLLADLFPTRMRATAAAIFTAGVPIGAGVALTVGGLIQREFGWRWAFYLLGFPGLLFAVLVLFVREPVRGSTEKKPATGAPPDAWKVVLSSGTLRFHYFGYAFFAMAGQALSMWIPSFIHKVFAMDLAEVGGYTGFSAAVGGLIGSVLGGLGADAFRKRWAGGRMRFSAMCAAICIPLWFAMLAAGSFWMVIIPYFVAMGFALSWMGAAAADVQDVVGPQLRGLGIGVYYFVVNVIGYGIGPVAIGRTSDALGVTTDPSMMRYSLLLCPAACAVAAVLLWTGARRMERAAAAA